MDTHSNPGSSAEKPMENEQQAKLIKMVDSAVESANRVDVENRLSGMASNLESVTGNDWAEFRSLAEGLNMTDEEEQAVNATISIMQSMRPTSSLEKRNESLQSFARTSKIIEVATATKVFERLPYAQWELSDPKTLIRSAASHLREALGLISNKYDVQEAVQIGGKGMSQKEFDEAMERGKKLNIV